jgi:fused signal recognition particle receptor
MEMFDEEMEKIALKEIKRENVRLEKEQVEKEAAARIADMKAQFDAAERSALLSVELEKAERKAQLQAEREEAERENLAREKQEAADKIAQELILEDMNRKSKAIDKAKGGRMIQRILSQQFEVVSREEHLERVSPNRSTQNLKSSVGAEEMDQIDDTSNNDEKRQQEFTASKINETPDFGRGVRDNMEGERVIGDRNQATVDDIKSENSPADIDNANAKVTEEDEILLQKEKAAKKQKRKEEKEAAFLAKVAAKREAKKQAKRKARMDEIKRKEDERTPPSLVPLVDN